VRMAREVRYGDNITGVRTAPGMENEDQSQASRIVSGDRGFVSLLVLRT
jgi:hypothetical protein